MNNNPNFTEFSKQSPKGILVIYGSLLYKSLKFTWVIIFLFIRKFSEMSEKNLFSVYLGIVVVLLIILIRAYLVYRNFQFKIENNHFVLKQGVLKKTNTSIPFDRIQNINFKQNLIQQIINVYQVSIETAGSKDTEIAIKALSYSKAQALKEQISLVSTSTDTDEAISTIESKALLKINFKELLKVSLTENHLQSLLLFIALLFGLLQQVRDTFNGLGKKEDLERYLDVETDAVFGSVIVFLVLLMFLFVVAIISSFVRVLLFHFNLTLFIKNDSFEINQGLLTKKSIVLKKEKVQTIVISTNPIKKWLRISFVTFKQAVSGKVNKKQNKLIRVVGCKLNHVIKIKELLFDYKRVEQEEKYSSDRYYKGRMYFRSLLGVLLLNGIGYLFLQDLMWFFMNLVLLPLTVYLIHLKYKKAFYQFSEELLLVGKGRIETHYLYVPFFKVQNIEMKQTIFQVRKNVVDLVLQTASGKIRIPCIKKERALKMYNYIVYKVESSKESWM